MKLFRTLKLWIQILEKNRKYQCYVFFVSLLILFVSYEVVETCIENKRTLARLTEQNGGNNASILFQIKSDNRKKQIEGILAKNDAEIKELYIILKHSNSKEIIVEVDFEEIESQNAVVDEKWDANTVQFKSEMDLGNEETNYEIMLGVVSLVTQNGITVKNVEKIKTNKYLYRGELLDTDVMKYMEPTITNKEIAEVIADGKICAYDMDLGLWIYSFDGCLYWIIKEDSFEKLPKKISVPVHTMTFNAKDLPKDRREHGYDNKDFYFTQKEVLLDGLDGYRVASIKLPEAYVTTYVRTGIFDIDNMKWIYRCEFQQYDY